MKTYISLLQSNVILTFFFCYTLGNINAQTIVHPQDNGEDDTYVNGIDFYEGAIYTDPGGTTGNYMFMGGGSSDNKVNLCANPGETFTLNFTYFNVTGQDYLTIMGDANGQNYNYGPLYNMTLLMPLMSADGGCLNFTFHTCCTDPEGPGWIAEVTQGFPAPAVPTLSQWGLIILGISIALMSVIFLRKDSKNEMPVTNKE